MVIAYGLVQVEGPLPVTDSAKQMFRAINDFRQQAIKRDHSETLEDGTEVGTALEPGPEVNVSGNAALAALNKFVSTARETLAD